MRRCLLCSGVHGRQQSLDWLKQIVNERRPEGIFFVGGILDPQRRCAVRATPWSLTTDDSLFILKFFRTLAEFGVFSAVISGCGGEPIEEFLQLGMQAELESPHVHVAHATLLEEEDVAVCGIGGFIAERPLLGVDSCSRTLSRYFLRALGTAKQPRRVLLLSTPPPGRLGGLAGSPLIEELIDTYHPSLCVVCGCAERQGAEWSGRTLVVNPGSLSDGQAAWLDWNRPIHKQIEFLDLHSMNAGCAAASEQLSGT
jgi:hypothetical protein